MKGKLIKVNEQLSINQKNVILAMCLGTTIHIVYGTNVSIHSKWFNYGQSKKTHKAIEGFLHTLVYEKGLIKNVVKTSINYDAVKCSIYFNRKINVAFIDHEIPQIVTNSGLYITLPSVGKSVAREIINKIIALL